jgi:hypothetical protein
VVVETSGEEEEIMEVSVSMEEVAHHLGKIGICRTVTHGKTGVGMYHHVPILHLIGIDPITTISHNKMGFLGQVLNRLPFMLLLQAQQTLNML